MTDLWELWWTTLPGPESLPSSRGWNNPVIVLTEGINDAEFLSEALEIIYPHLTDLIRFLDYGQRPMGGAGPVLVSVKAFAAAGIANRLVAVLDNDTAAADALRTLDQARLPWQIRVIGYPNSI